MAGSLLCVHAGFCVSLRTAAATAPGGPPARWPAQKPRCGARRFHELLFEDSSSPALKASSGRGNVIDGAHPGRLCLVWTHTNRFSLYWVLNSLTESCKTGGAARRKARYYLTRATGAVGPSQASVGHHNSGDSESVLMFPSPSASHLAAHRPSSADHAIPVHGVSDVFQPSVPSGRL